MPTVQHYIDQQPNIFVQRYGSSRWISWLNDLLEELSGKGVLPLTLFEKGVVPEHGCWIEKPDGLKTVDRIVSPYTGAYFNFDEVNNKIKLDENVFPTVAVTSDSLSGFSTDGLTVDIVDVTDEYDEDYFKSYLMQITAGTLKGQTFVIAGNDASTGGTTALKFLHPISSAWTGVEATAVKLYSIKNYLMMSYTGSYAEVSLVSDDLGISKDFDRIVSTYLRYRAEKFTSSVSNETVVWGQNYQGDLRGLFGERLNTFGGPAKGRYLAGAMSKRKFR